MTTELNRREIFRLFSAAALAAPLALPAPDPGAPLYFTREEFALLDTLTELIIPADAHSPGAHEAGVAAYIDKTTAEAFAPEDKTSWRKGLKMVDDLARSTYKKPFLEAAKPQQIALLTKISSGGTKHPKGQHEEFFAQLKDSTANAYYSSKIGIHQETEYKGNCILQEYVGYLPSAELPPLTSL